MAAASTTATAASASSRSALGTASTRTGAVSALLAGILPRIVYGQIIGHGFPCGGDDHIRTVLVQGPLRGIQIDGPGCGGVVYPQAQRQRKQQHQRIIGSGGAGQLRQRQIDGYREKPFADAVDGLQDQREQPQKQESQREDGQRRHKKQQRMHLQLIRAETGLLRQKLMLPEHIPAVAGQRQQNHIQEPLLPDRLRIRPGQRLLQPHNGGAGILDGRDKGGAHSQQHSRQAVHHGGAVKAHRDILPVDEGQKPVGGADALGHEPAQQRAGN
ncbi:hypothetical protein D3C75_561590 [compost metagenome]